MVWLWQYCAGEILLDLLLISLLISPPTRIWLLGRLLTAGYAASV